MKNADQLALALDQFTRTFLPDAVTQYETTAPTVAAHCDDLYIRLTTKQEPKDYPTVQEVFAVQLLSAAGWMLPNAAANHIYHLRHRLGMDVTGHTGF